MTDAPCYEKEPWLSILLYLLTGGQPALYSLFLLFFLSHTVKTSRNRKPTGSGFMLEAGWAISVELAIRNHSLSLICLTKPDQEQFCSLTCQPPTPSSLQNAVRLKSQAVSPFYPQKHFGKILLIWTIQDDLTTDPLGSTFEIQLEVSQLGREEQKLCVEATPAFRSHHILQLNLLFLLQPKHTTKL